jgi:hypothetical protein
MVRLNPQIVNFKGIRMFGIMLNHLQALTSSYQNLGLRIQITTSSAIQVHEFFILR